MTKYIATFYTHYGAIKFRQYCKAKDITASMMPTPRILGASCGVCIQFAVNNCTMPVQYCEYDSYDLENYYELRTNGEYTKWIPEGQ